MNITDDYIGWAIHAYHESSGGIIGTWEPTFKAAVNEALRLNKDSDNKKIEFIRCKYKNRMSVL